MRSDSHQIILIISGIFVTSLFGVFLYREIFPEYKIYQNDYIALEEFRSSYTDEAPPFFQTGVKQIVLEREDKGPATIDRCISCHVALEIPYFSPTKIAHDLNGNIVRDEKGHPSLVPNENYIWGILDKKINELRDEKVIEQLKKEGKKEEIRDRLDEAKNYESLKIAHVGHQDYDVTKVLAMHPLMGNETYPFQYHPLEEYGCTSCHNGNGRGLVTDKAHGPVFDRRYEIEEMGHAPQFTEKDPKNDPPFARIFNHKPGEELIFQTEPIFVGSLIQAKCIQCHQTSDIKVNEAQDAVSNLASLRQKRVKRLTEAFENEKQATIDLLKLRQIVAELGYERSIEQLKINEQDYSLPPFELEHLASRIKYLTQAAKGQPEGNIAKTNILATIDLDLVNLLGSQALVEALERLYQVKGPESIDPFLLSNRQNPEAKGILFVKGKALDLNQDLMRHAEEADQSFSKTLKNRNLAPALLSDVDELTKDYQRGKELYISQGCYACHRITSFSRGGVGPELTRAGDNYPWYLKRKLSWPQGDLPTSTMPNMHFDSEEIEDLMTFLLAQKGSNRAVSKTDYQSGVQAWEAGRKMSWENPTSPAQIYDLRYSMSIFATEGCAACHRLQGFDSNVGYAVEKKSPGSPLLYEEENWFKKLFPEVIHFSYYDEELPGSDIVATIEKHAKEIDERIINDVRKNSILEDIDLNHPEVLESFYSTFRYASRAKNDHYQSLIENEKDSLKVEILKKEWMGWKERVHRVLMVYIQTYGLGRLIGPHLNWSGIYRSDEWLIEHFNNPTSRIPRSIMPIFPFDQTKFLALTHMLDVLAIHNRNILRQRWDQQGFNPEEAYQTLCSQCHGTGRLGNGVIAEWIYPIPKNLHNQDFLRNLTKDKAIESIQRGVKGTPMAGWGEVATDKSEKIRKDLGDIPVLKEDEIHHLVDWIFTGLPGGEVIRQSSDVPKWQYTPEDVLKELNNEGGHLELIPNEKEQQTSQNEKLSSLLSRERISIAGISSSLEPKQEQEKKKNVIDIKEIFDVVSDPNNPKMTSYLIKQKFYTAENIEKGRAFFLLNCAVCHGTEADGSGTRAQAMQEAKPRMLTNLDWMDSHDDLRLLRSIKFGVSGTSMTPWGDFTSSLQRIQLVVFIRSLTKEQEKRSQLLQAVYQGFDASFIVLEEARIAGSKQLEELQQEEKNLNEKQDDLSLQNVKGTIGQQDLLSLYEQRLQLKIKMNDLERKDHNFRDLKSNLKAEKELYFNLGINLIGKNASESMLKNYEELIRLNANRYTIEDHQLVIHHDPKLEEKMRDYRKKITDELESKVADLEREKKIEEGKMTSSEQREVLNNLQSEIEAYKKLRAKVVTDTEEALRLARDQQKK